MHRFFFAVIFFFTCFLIPSLQAKILYVNIHDPVCNDQQGRPFCHISSAIRVSLDNDEINIARGIYYETLSIDKNLHLRGEDQRNTVVNAIEKSSVVTIDPGVHVQLSAITLQNGLADNGGGIFNQGSLTIDNVLIINNVATYSGGGIFNAGSVSGSLTIKNSQISYNYSLGDDDQNVKYGGAGIFNNGPLRMTNSELRFNRAVDNGGGLYSIFSGRKKFSDGEIFAEKLGMTSSFERQRNLQRKQDVGAVSIEHSLFDNNSANVGGGINLHGVLNLSTSILSNNRAMNGTLSEGGGLFAHFDNTLNMSNVLINFNQATFRGGGIRFYSSNIGHFTNVSIIDNTVLNNFGRGAGLLIIQGKKSLEIKNSLIARNYIAQSASIRSKIADCYGEFTSAGHNYVSSIQDCAGFDKSQDNYQVNVDLMNLYRWDAELKRYQIINSSQLLKITNHEICQDEKNKMILEDVYGNARDFNAGITSNTSPHCAIGAIAYPSL